MSSQVGNTKYLPAGEFFRMDATHPVAAHAG